MLLGEWAPATLDPLTEKQQLSSFFPSCAIAGCCMSLVPLLEKSVNPTVCASSVSSG